MNLWLLVLATGGGCYLLKLAGYLVPTRLSEHQRVRSSVELLPVALLAALVVVQAVAAGRHWDFDGPRLAGLAVGAFAVWRRLPFLIVVIAAALTTALLRLA